MSANCLNLKSRLCVAVILLLHYAAADGERFDDVGDGYQSTLGHLHPQTPANVQKTAAVNLITRVLGQKDASKFDVVIDKNIEPLGKDTFKLKKTGSNKVEITGTSGLAVAWGLHYYLKHHCNCHISWEGSQLKLPDELPDIDASVTSNDRFRYYQNVCTVGYSSTWWDWDEWEKNIDWMALNGINLALAFHAQEAIWQRVYYKLKLRKEEIDQHFGGPAFLPWARMGNIRGWGGPLSEAWHNRTIRLQHLILARMRELGMTPVLPAFAGHVPRDFVRVYPNASVTKVEAWNDFDDEYCCPYMLDPTDPLFQVVGKEFLDTYIAEFGTNHIYNCDSFNEIDPLDGDLDYIANVAKATYSTMTSADPDAIWLMQGWLFVNSDYFWNKLRVMAYLTSVPLGKMIILDLQSEQKPQYERFHSYYGQPFIWCMLHNFGGTLGLFGSAGIVNERVFEARRMNGSTMIGTGLTPEGINQNYVVYELMNEMAYRKKAVDLDDWFANYATRRYGVVDATVNKAWQELGRTVYNYNDTLNVRGHYVITKRPSLNIQPWYWYDLKSFFIIWSHFIEADDRTTQSNLFKHDLVDITRQALQTTADFVYSDIKTSFKRGNLTRLRSASNQMLELFDDLEEILASSPDFLLGKWLESAKLAASQNDSLEIGNLEFNARNQITLWGPDGQIVDYANKQWSGVVKDYFRARWAVYLKGLSDTLENHEKINNDWLRKRIFNEVELPFSYSKKIYPVKPMGNSIKIAAKIYEKWHQLWK